MSILLLIILENLISVHKNCKIHNYPWQLYYTESQGEV